MVFLVGAAITGLMAFNAACKYLFPNYPELTEEEKREAEERSRGDHPW